MITRLKLFNRRCSMRRILFYSIFTLLVIVFSFGLSDIVLAGDYYCVCRVGNWQIAPTDPGYKGSPPYECKIKTSFYELGVADSELGTPTTGNCGNFITKTKKPSTIKMCPEPYIQCRIEKLTCNKPAPGCGTIYQMWTSQKVEMAKWASAGATSKSPIKVADLGDTASFSVKITAPGDADLEDISFKNTAASSYITLKNHTGIKAGETREITVEWDTSKMEPALGLIYETLVATRKPPVDIPTERKIHIDVDVKCDEQIKGLDCSKEDQVEKCKQKCGGGDKGQFCAFVSGVCKKKTDLTSAEKTKLQQEATKAYLEARYITPEIEEYIKKGGVIPACAFAGTCEDVTDLLQVVVNFGKFMFGGIASFAFVFFVYGGFTIILSMGNPEKVKKGQQILIAAVVGLVVALGAYLLIDFMLDAIGVSGEFRAIK